MVEVAMVEGSKAKVTMMLISKAAEEMTPN